MMILNISTQQENDQQCVYWALKKNSVQITEK